MKYVVQDAGESLYLRDTIRGAVMDWLDLTDCGDRAHWRAFVEQATTYVRERCPIIVETWTMQTVSDKWVRDEVDWVLEHVFESFEEVYGEEDVELHERPSDREAMEAAVRACVSGREMPGDKVIETTVLDFDAVMQLLRKDA